MVLPLVDLVLATWSEAPVRHERGMAVLMQVNQRAQFLFVRGDCAISHRLAAAVSHSLATSRIDQHWSLLAKAADLRNTVGGGPV